MSFLLVAALSVQLSMGVIQPFVPDDPSAINRESVEGHPENEVFYEICAFYVDKITQSYVVKFKHIGHDPDGYMKVYWEGRWHRLSISVLMRRMPTYEGPEKHIKYP